MRQPAAATDHALRILSLDGAHRVRRHHCEGGQPQRGAPGGSRQERDGAAVRVPRGDPRPQYLRAAAYARARHASASDVCEASLAWLATTCWHWWSRPTPRRRSSGAPPSRRSQRCWASSLRQRLRRPIRGTKRRADPRCYGLCRLLCRRRGRCAGGRGAAAMQHVDRRTGAHAGAAAPLECARHAAHASAEGAGFPYDLAGAARASAAGRT